MMPKRYVEKLDASEGDLPGLYGIEHARKPGSWRFVCSYADAKRYKQVIFDRLRKAGQPEAAKTWEWHHVVEGQHFADIDFAGEFSRAYLDELPCVLIAKDEHLAYNRILHTKATSELYRDIALPADLQRRAKAVCAEARVRTNHGALRARLLRLRKLYHDTYEGDEVLMTISDNVFDVAVRKLR